MAELERALTELRVEWPATPDIADAVRKAITEGAAPRRRRLAIPSRDRLALRPALAYAAALLLVALGTTMAVSEPARSAILEFLGLKGAKIERRAPDAPPTPTAGRAALGADLGLGERVTLAQARDQAGFEAVPPTGVGAPGAIYVDDLGGVTFVYAPRKGFPESAHTGAGLLVTQVLGQVAPYVEKSAGPNTRIERFTVDGDDAFFVSGGPHGVAFEAYAAGDVQYEDQRLAGNTLLLEHGDVLLRIEGEISRDRAVAVARTITATLDS